MRKPEWPYVKDALQERERRAPILERIGKINPDAKDPYRLSARRVHYFYTMGNYHLHPSDYDHEKEYRDLIGTHTTTQRQDEAKDMFKMLADELGPINIGNYSPGTFLLNYSSWIYASISRETIYG